MPLIQGSIGTLTTTRIPDGTSNNIGVGRQSDLWVNELHGRHYTSNFNGLLFHGLVNAVTVPVNAANLVSVCSLINPVGSPRTLEVQLIEVYSVLAATIVGGVNVVQQSLKGGSVLPTTFTLGVTNPGLVGGAGAASGLFCSAATHIGTPVVQDHIGFFGAVTTTAANLIQKDFNGSLILAPGSIISIVMSTAPSTASGLGIHVAWSEGPLNG
jgi:hypothetical protein